MGEPQTSIFFVPNINRREAPKIFEKMQIQIFTIPVFADQGQVEEMNRFLRSHSIIDIEKNKNICLLC